MSRKLPRRHPNDRPPAGTLAPDTPPSWWVGLTREQLVTEAEARLPLMRGTKEYTYIPFRMLQ